MFQVLLNELKKELANTEKGVLLEQYIEKWQQLMRQQAKYPNTKSKEYKKIEKELKICQQKLFALRTAQIKESSF